MLNAASILVDQHATPSLHYVFTRQDVRGETTLVMQRASDGALELMGEYISSRPRSGSIVLEKARSSAWFVGQVMILRSQTGEEYLGASVDAGTLKTHLARFKREVGQRRYREMRDRQAARDGGGFHITLIEPREYPAVAGRIPDGTGWKGLATGSLLWFRLEGLGHAADANTGNETYFVVAASRRANSLRRDLGLAEEALHATLGFDKEDVHGVNKGPDLMLRSRAPKLSWLGG